MASGNTLEVFAWGKSFFPTTNYAAFGVRGDKNVPVLNFDDTAAETAYFLCRMPRHYSGGGITLDIEWAAASATSGNVGWTAALARLNAGNQDLDAVSFGTAATIAAAAVNATCGKITKSSVSIANGTDMNGVTAGDLFVLSITRDTAAGSNATGDAQLLGGEIRET